MEQDIFQTLSDESISGWFYQAITLVGIAVEKGLKEFYGIIERRNRRMVSLCRKMVMVEEPLPDGLIRVRLDL
ncbi:MAG TPA: hypothetical protein PKH03_09595 [Syntrophales bacterium]|nr:hypothetical protein [Syntrophales bacterium]